MPVTGPSLNDAARRGLLLAAHNPVAERVVSRWGMRLGARRFVAGTTLDDCLVVLAALNRMGLRANTTILGEGTADRAGAEAVAAEYVEVLGRIAAAGLDANVSCKLTHLGLGIDPALAHRNVERVARAGAEVGRLVRMDMEESGWVDATLDIYRRLRAADLENVGVVLQAYLQRTPEDLRQLLPLRPNLRLVKGAYLESPAVAHARKTDVDHAYLQLMEQALRDAGYTAIATHDERLIEHAIAYTTQRRIPRERFEFQMLYGVRPGLQRALVGRGYRVLVAAPFGSHWYPYLMRRLAERPANIGFFVRNLFHT